MSHVIGEYLWGSRVSTFSHRCLGSQSIVKWVRWGCVRVCFTTRHMACILSAPL
jgi:hypothetical protein